jgi:hypothetical protein
MLGSHYFVGKERNPQANAYREEVDRSRRDRFFGGEIHVRAYIEVKSLGSWGLSNNPSVRFSSQIINFMAN